MAKNGFVGHFRVSTHKQGRSGLELEAQRYAVEGYINGRGWHIIGQCAEIESGRRSGTGALPGETGRTLYA